MSDAIEYFMTDLLRTFEEKMNFTYIILIQLFCREYFKKN